MVTAAFLCRGLFSERTGNDAPRSPHKVHTMPVKEITLQEIGEYNLVEKLGEGTVGAVYKGVHRKTGEVVAIKVLNKEAAADEVLLKRFEREFKIASRLHHPHIVRSLDLNLQGKLPYLVMEFLEGPSVGDLIEKRGRLPEAEAIALIAQMAGALQEAHDHGIYHRDVKPGNILLTADG